MTYKLRYNATEGIPGVEWSAAGTVVHADYDDVVAATVEDVGITLASGDTRLEPDHTLGRLLAAAPALQAALDAMVAGVENGDPGAVDAALPAAVAALYLAEQG